MISCSLAPFRARPRSRRTVHCVADALDESEFSWSCHLEHQPRGNAPLESQPPTTSPSNCSPSRPLPLLSFQEIFIFEALPVHSMSTSISARPIRGQPASSSLFLDLRLTTDGEPYIQAMHLTSELSSLSWVQLPLARVTLSFRPSPSRIRRCGTSVPHGARDSQRSQHPRLGRVLHRKPSRLKDRT